MSAGRRWNSQGGGGTMSAGRRCEQSVGGGEGQ